MAYHAGCHVIQAINTQARHVPMAAAPDDYVHQTHWAPMLQVGFGVKNDQHLSWGVNIGAQWVRLWVLNSSLAVIGWDMADDVIAVGTLGYGSGTIMECNSRKL